MLTFESPFYEIDGVIVFRDHASPATFHYLAGPPRLSRTPEGKPNLLLLKYKNALDSSAAAPTLREQLGGGFLLFGVDCGIPEDVKGSIAQKLQALAPAGGAPGGGADGVSLVPVLYSAGKVQVLALDRQSAVVEEADAASPERSRFVRGILGTATPSLLQDQRAIFSLALDPDAATLLEDAYESGLSPIGVMYELEFMGLRPALAVRAKVHKQRVYSQLKAGLQIGVGSGGGQSGGGGGRAGATGGAAGEAGGGGREGEGERRTGEGGASGRGSSSGTRVAINADLSLLMENLKESGAIEIEIVRQQEGTTVDQMEARALELLKEAFLKEFFKPAMSSTPAAPSAATAASAASAARGLMASSADTSKGRAAGGSQVEIGFQLQYKKQEELQEAEYDFSVIAPEKRTHAPNGFFSTLLDDTEKAEHMREINLDDDFFKTLQVALSTTADFEGIDLKKVVVDLQYGGTIAQPAVSGVAEFEPGQAAPRFFTAFLNGRDVSYRYRVDYKFGQAERIAAQRQSYQTPWQTTTSRALVVHPPEDVAMLRVRVEPGPVDWDIVDRIETRLAYDDAANGFRTDRTFLMGAASQPEEWIVRLSDPQLRVYQVQHVWYLKDHSEITGDPYVEDTPQLFVRDPFDHRLDIRVVPQVDPANVRRIHVEFHYEDPGNEHEVRKSLELEGPEFRPQSVTIPVMDPRRRRYSYSVTLIQTNGRTEIHAPKVTDQESITVTEGGIYLDVRVVLLGDLAQLGIDAIQVDLRSEPLAGEREKVEEHLFLPGGEAQVVKRLMLRADRPQAFEYRTTVFGAQGPRQSPWKEHESAILALPARSLVE